MTNGSDPSPSFEEMVQKIRNATSDDWDRIIIITGQRGNGMSASVISKENIDGKI